MYSARSKSQIPFIIVLTSVVLAFCILIGSVSAWLTKEYNHHSEDNQIGEVLVELYHDGVKMAGTFVEVEGVSRWQCNTPYQITDTGGIRDDINLTMRNNGTIDALVRVTMTIYYIDSNNNQVCLLVTERAPTMPNTCKLDTTTFVYDMAGSGSVAGGYMYYNDKLSPYTYREIETNTPGDDITEITVPANEKPLLNSLMVSSDLESTQLYVDVTIDACAYSGNIYKKLENNEVTLDDTKYSALPFGLKDYLPDDWVAWK